MKTKQFALRPLLAVILLCSAPGEAVGQSYEAFCALRDPKHEIDLLAPKNKGFHSLVRTITTESRTEILREVPFSMHFDELGQHTLYLVLRSDGHIGGYVHVRSESFQWGLVKIAWMMNTDLEITGYEFQRCRSPWRGELESPAVSKLVVGRTMRELLGLISQDGSGRSRVEAPVPEGARDLMTVLIQSAIKTRIVTGIVWEQEVGTIKADSMAREHFGGKTGVRQSIDLYDERIQAALSARGLAKSIGFERAQVFCWRAIGRDGSIKGSLICTPWSAGDEHAKLWWSLDADGRILAVEDSQRSLEASSSRLFQGLVGRRFVGEEECKTACELAALEVTLLNNQD